jgi:hypothetical protein
MLTEWDVDLGIEIVLCKYGNKPYLFEANRSVGGKQIEDINGLPEWDQYDIGWVNIVM